MSICDGDVDCTSGEDEFLCNLPRTCPNSCLCLMYALQCDQGHFLWGNVFEWAQQFAFIQFSNVNVLQPRGKFPSSTTLAVFMWVFSSVQDICFQQDAFENIIQLLDYSSNNIQKLTMSCFCTFTSLEVLLLAHNKINTVPSKTFECPEKLSVLNMSGNQLVSLDFLRNIGGKELVVDVRKNIKPSFYELKTPNIKMIFTDDFSLCCLLMNSDTLCSKSPVWPQNCFPLLETSVCGLVLKISLSSIIVLNLISILLKIIKLISNKFSVCDRKDKRMKKTVSKPYVLQLLILHSIDLAQGFYLLSLSIANDSFGDNFFRQHLTWRCSLYCEALGSLALFLYLNCLLLQNFHTIYRLIAVTCPFNTKIKRTNTVLKFLMFGVLSVFVVCFVHSVVLFRVENLRMMPHPTCLVLGDFKTSVTIRFSTIVMIVLEAVSLVIVSVAYSIISCKIYNSNQFGQKQRQQKTVAGIVQSIFIVFFSVLCWLTSAVVLCITVIMNTFPTQLIIWTVVLIHPVHSTSNPLLLTLISVYKSFIMQR